MKGQGVADQQALKRVVVFNLMSTPVIPRNKFAEGELIIKSSPYYDDIYYTIIIYKLLSKGYSVAFIHDSIDQKNRMISNLEKSRIDLKNGYLKEMLFIQAIERSHSKEAEEIGREWGCKSLDLIGSERNKYHIDQKIVCMKKAVDELQASKVVLVDYMPFIKEIFTSIQQKQHFAVYISKKLHNDEGVVQAIENCFKENTNSVKRGNAKRKRRESKREVKLIPLITAQDNIEVLKEREALFLRKIKEQDDKINELMYKNSNLLYENNILNGYVKALREDNQSKQAEIDNLKNRRLLELRNAIFRLAQENIKLKQRNKALEEEYVGLGTVCLREREASLESPRNDFAVEVSISENMNNYNAGLLSATQDYDSYFPFLAITDSPVANVNNPLNTSGLQSATPASYMPQENPSRDIPIYYSLLPSYTPSSSFLSWDLQCEGATNSRG
jgi:hypothetical protein